MGSFGQIAWCRAFPADLTRFLARGKLLAQQLRPYGVKPRTLWLNGAQAKGYFSEEFTDISQRYISQSELDALKQESEEPPPSATNNGSGQTAAL